MKCHYEVLGIERDSNDTAIKSAYRKLALRWHPDKNLDSPNEAKEQFQLVQQAYDVLSDPQERAWFDSHREQILRGKNSDYQENCLDLFQYFTISCFRGYGDEPGGFYKVYAEVFEKIAAEDAEFMEDEEEIDEIPKFGSSTSNYEQVVAPFYAHWQSYCTKKNFAWLCPYDITEIKDRRILREIEKDMKKVVQKAKRERNEEVRNLVSFIRKRDKRVQANKKLLEERAEANRKKQEQNRLDQIRRRQKEVEESCKNQSQNMLYEGYEEQLKQLEQEYVNSSSEIETEDETAELANGTSEMTLEGEEVIYLDELYCVACNKSFRNENAFSNHESSKKHKENVETLRCEMKEDEKLFENEEAQQGENVEVISAAATESDIEEELVTTSSKKKRKQNKAMKSLSKTKSESESAEDVGDLLKEATIEDIDWDDNKKSGKKSRNKKGNPKKVSSQQNGINQSEIPREPKEDVPKMKAEVSYLNEMPIVDLNHICVTCKSSFDSKNKLFTHLKKTNHGVFIPKQGAPVAKASSRKGKKKS